MTSPWSSWRATFASTAGLWVWPPDRIAQDIHAVMGDQGLSFGDVTAMVNTAEATYCPNGG